MPQLPLASALLRSLPWLSARGRAVINFLILDNGRASSATSLASRLGLSSRYQLARLLRSEGLPTYETLTGWISSLCWHLEAERSDATLVALSQRSDRALAASYRLVRRVTGSRWRELRRSPADELLRRFLEQCGPPRQVRVVSRLRPGDAWLNHAGVASDAARVAPAAAVRLPLDGAPFALAFYDEREAYITCVHAGVLERLDVVARRFVGAVPVGSVPSCLAVDRARQRAYASLQYEDTIAVIDTRAHVVVDRLPVSGDPFPVLLSPSGARLYAATNEDRLHALALPSGSVAASMPLPATSHFLTLHPAGHRLYVATRLGGTVLEVDTKWLGVNRIFELGGEPHDLRVTADGRWLYVANGRQGLNVVRLIDGRVVRTVPFGGRPVHLALSADERTIYVSQVEAGSVAVVNCASWSVRSYVTGGRPRALSISRGGGILLVANETGWVDLISI